MRDLFTIKGRLDDRFSDIDSNIQSMKTKLDTLRTKVNKLKEIKSNGCPNKKVFRSSRRGLFDPNRPSVSY